MVVGRLEVVVELRYVRIEGVYLNRILFYFESKIRFFFVRLFGIIGK